MACRSLVSGALPERRESHTSHAIIAVMGKATDSIIDRGSSGLALKTLAGLIVVHHSSSPEDVEPAKSPWETTPSPKSTDMTAFTSFHLNGFFVHPSARRVGLGQRLIQVALQHVRVLPRRMACDTPKSV